MESKNSRNRKRTASASSEDSLVRQIKRTPGAVGDTSSKTLKDFFSTSWSDIFDRFLFNYQEQLEVKVFPLIADLFIHYGVPKERRPELMQFISQITRYYHNNVYHNAVHALHVTINCAHVLSKIQHKYQHEFHAVERLALIFAALIHDAGHLGVPNVALIRKGHPFAIQYHDQSVAEMHSLTLGLTALEMGQHVLLSHLTADERVKFRKYLIDFVLCTDIADGLKKKILDDRLDLASHPERGYLNLNHQDGKSAFLGLLLRMCDVGSGMQSLPTAEHWAMNFYLETKFGALQGDGLVPEAQKCYAGQIYYLEAHSLALAKKVSQTMLMEESWINELVYNIEEHIRWWKSFGYDSISKWEDDGRLKALLDKLSKQSASECKSQSSAITMSTSTAVKTSSHEGGQRTRTSTVSISVSQDANSQSLEIVDEEEIVTSQTASSSTSSSSHRKRSKAVRSISTAPNSSTSGGDSNTCSTTINEDNKRKSKKLNVVPDESCGDEDESHQNNNKLRGHASHSGHTVVRYPIRSRQG